MLSVKLLNDGIIKVAEGNPGKCRPQCCHHDLCRHGYNVHVLEVVGRKTKPRVSVSGVQVNEDLQSFEVGPALDRSAFAGGDAEGESS